MCIAVAARLMLSLVAWPVFSPSAAALRTFPKQVFNMADIGPLFMYFDPSFSLLILP